MDFLNSLSQVAKNQKNFKKWEDNQHDEQPRRRELAADELAGGRASAAQQYEHLANYVLYVLPVADENADQRAEVQQHVEEKMALLERVQVEQVLQHGQMPAAGYGQKLGQPLYEPEEDCRPDIQRKYLHCSHLESRRFMATLTYYIIISAAIWQEHAA